ncbi:MAG TPA: hypothetical protein VL576_00755 [Candidatus Paceibacterota bacterium]|jgi:hypothetical protein|nr:hypothetical protein [Candidatus Paceibacterota bacterium]
MQTFISRYYQPLFALILVFIIGFAFYAGFLEGKSTPSQQVVLSCKENILSKLSIPLEKLANLQTADAASTAMAHQGGAYVGSKNGTKYYPSATCSAVKRIKPENYLWFNSAEDAQIQGYTPGKC